MDENMIEQLAHELREARRPMDRPARRRWEHERRLISRKALVAQRAAKSDPGNHEKVVNAGALTSLDMALSRSLQIERDEAK